MLTVTEPWASGFAGFSGILGYKSNSKSVFFIDGWCEQPSEIQFANQVKTSPNFIS